ncbi:hypothetical protein [Azospirillum argentinense]|uniref:hypothetical protein n=1 Tax=Azospirillum argentinense TaxID=2970906 RepID=UPI001186E48F|nr:hypothetical protein [Azospirillum argentinense]
MLVEFFIDPEAIGHSSTYDDALFYSNFESFLESWRRYGVWVCPNNKEYIDLLSEALVRAPQDVRTLFERASARFRRADLDYAMLPSLPVRHPQHRTAFNASVVGISPSSARFLSFNDREFTRIFSQEELEVCRLEALASSNAFRKTRELSESPIMPGVTRESVWRERIDKLVHYSATIMIADKFALERIWRAADAINKSPSDGVEEIIDRNGTCFLLNKAISNGNDKNLIIYTQSLSQTKIELCERYLKEIVSINGGALSSLQLRMKTKYPEHDRFLRFDDHCVLTLGSGVELLDCATVGPNGDDDKSHDCNMKIVSEIYREIEGKLNRLCTNRISIF